MATSIKIGILTASDRCARGKKTDESGTLLKSLAKNLPAEVIAYQVFPDDRAVLEKALSHMADSLQCDLIVTTGGTGLSPRDQTPEATKAVIEKEVPGIAQAIRDSSLKQTKFAILSRGVAGVRGKTLIINLPGSPKAVQNAFTILEPILSHAIELIRGKVKDCGEVRNQECKQRSQTLPHYSHFHS